VFSIVLNANDDSTTTPIGSYYSVVISLGSEVLSEFDVVIGLGQPSSLRAS